MAAYIGLLGHNFDFRFAISFLFYTWLWSSLCLNAWFIKSVHFKVNWVPFLIWGPLLYGGLIDLRTLASKVVGGVWKEFIYRWLKLWHTGSNPSRVIPSEVVRVTTGLAGSARGASRVRVKAGAACSTLGASGSVDIRDPSLCKISNYL